jgi:hypothetical protein
MSGGGYSGPAYVWWWVGFGILMTGVVGALMIGNFMFCKISQESLLYETVLIGNTSSILWCNLTSS